MGKTIGHMILRRHGKESVINYQRAWNMPPSVVEYSPGFSYDDGSMSMKYKACLNCFLTEIAIVLSFKDCPETNVSLWKMRSREPLSSA